MVVMNITKNDGCYDIKNILGIFLTVSKDIFEGIFDWEY